MDGQMRNNPQGDFYEAPQGASPQDISSQFPGQEPRQQSFDPKPHKKYFSGFGLRYLAGAIIIFGVQILVSAIVQLIWPDAQEDYGISILTATVPMYLVGMPLLILIVKGIPPVKPEKRKFSVGKFFLYFLVAYGVMIAANFLATIVGLIIEMLVSGAQASTNVVQSIALEGNQLVNFIIMVICAPIMEELIFRKILVDRVLKYGEGTAVVLSGLFFGLFHGNLTQGTYAFAIGCIFAYIYCKYGDIRITIGIHMILNFIGSIVGVNLLKLIGYEDYLEVAQSGDVQAMIDYMMSHIGGFALYGGYLILVFGAVVTAAVLLIVNFAKHRITFAPGQITIPKGKRFGTVIVNVGMILYIVFFLGVIVYEMIAPALLH